MIFWKKKLIECCNCKKKYSFDDNLFYHLKEYILVCPNCNLMHKVDIQLLGKEYDKLKKMDRLNLTAIDIGSVCIDRTGVTGGNFTLIDLANPADYTGKITNVAVWAQTSMASAKVATFYRPDATNFPEKFTARDVSGNLGVVESGDIRNFAVNLDVFAGDFIGIYFTDGGDFIEWATTGGVGVYRLAGDQTACVNTTFTLYANRAMSLYGTGATLGWPHKWNGITIGKLNGAVISKWNGVA